VSAFADYATVSRRSLVKIDSELTFEEAALFGCAVLTGVGAVVNTARVPVGSAVAVVGLGGVGLSSLLGAVAAGARQVVAVDLSDEKLDLARDLGATMTVNARDPDAADQIRAASHGGVEYAFELAGSTRALDLAFRITRRGGTTVTAGLPPPADSGVMEHRVRRFWSSRSGSFGAVPRGWGRSVSDGSAAGHLLPGCVIEESARAARA
jgi:alcohol dehydrogenase